MVFNIEKNNMEFEKKQNYKDLENNNFRKFEGGKTRGFHLQRFFERDYENPMHPKIIGLGLLEDYKSTLRDFINGIFKIKRDACFVVYRVCGNPNFQKFNSYFL